MPDFRYPTLIALLLAGAACQQPAAEASDATGGADAIPASAPAPAQDAQQALTESDKLLLEMAEAACRQNDFSGFVAAYARSPIVRARHTAANIQHGQSGASKPVTRDRYLAGNLFPITMIDTYWITSESRRAFDAADGDAQLLVIAQLETNMASDRRARVDWVSGRMDYDPQIDEGEGTFVQTGPGGYLLFYSTKDCWELVEDVRSPL